MKLSDSITIRLTLLDLKETQLNNLLNNCHKILNFIPMPTKEAWKSYEECKKNIAENLESYEGRFKSYFQNSFDLLKKEEKWALDYNLND